MTVAEMMAAAAEGHEAGALAKPALAEAVKVVIRSAADPSDELAFRLPRTKRFRKMFKIWAEKRGVPVKDQRFMFGQVEVGQNDDPAGLEMENDAIITAEVLGSVGYSDLV